MEERSTVWASYKVEAMLNQYGLKLNSLFSFWCELPTPNLIETRGVFSKHTYADRDMISSLPFILSTLFTRFTEGQLHKYLMALTFSLEPEIVNWPVLWIELHYLYPYKISDNSFPMDEGLNQLCIFQIWYLSSEFWILWEK